MCIRDRGKSSEKRHLPEDAGQLSICFESPSDVNDPVAEEQKTAEKSAKSENGYNRFRKSCLLYTSHVANAKDVNAVLGYMEQTGKVPEVSPIAPPEVSARDTAELMDPGDYFNIQVRQNLKQSYRGPVSYTHLGCKFFLAGSQIHFCCVDKGRLSAPFFSTGVIGVSFFGRFRICIIEICRMIDFNFDYKLLQLPGWRHLHIKPTFRSSSADTVRQRFLFAREI